MKFVFEVVVFSFAMFAAGCSVSSGDGAFTIDPAKTKVCELVLADDAIPAENTAAKLLERHLSKMLPGVKVLIAKESAACRDGSCRIYVGATKALKAAGFDISGWDAEEELIAACDGALFISGGRPRGARYAAADFLEELGVVVAADDTEVSPILKKLEWRRPVFRRKPAFKARYTATPAIRQQRLNEFNKYNGYRIGGETFGGYASYGKYGDCHTFVRYSKELPIDDPSVFAMVKGKRRVPVKAGVKAPLCPTSPKVLAFFLKSLEEDVERSKKIGSEKMTAPRYYEISMDDELTVCECSECRRVAAEEGCYAGVMLRLVNPLAKRLAELDPSAKLSMLVYQKTLDYPKVTKPERNVLPRVCVHDREWLVNVKAEAVEPVTSPHNASFLSTLEAWAGATDTFGIWEYWEYYTKSPFPCIAPRTYVENMRYYRKRGAESMLVEIEHPTDSFYAFKNWLALKLMDDPDVDYGMLRDRFFAAYYAKAAEPMKGYLALLSAAVESEYARAAMGERSVATYAFLNTDFYRKALALLAEAEAAAADDGRSLRHVRSEYIVLDHSLLGRGKEKTLRELGLTRKQILSRIQSCTVEYLKSIFPANSDTLKKRLKDAENFIVGASIDAPVPPEVKGEVFFDYKFNSFHLTNTLRLVDDSDALGGKAVEIVKPPTSSLKGSFHAESLSAGVYNGLMPVEKRVGAQFKLTDVPQDEKYHLYHIGRCPLVSGSRIWVHWSWYFQFAPRTAYTMTPDYDSDVWISVKLTGPAYVKGSTKPNGIFIDRVIIAR